MSSVNCVPLYIVAVELLIEHVHVLHQPCTVTFTVTRHSAVVAAPFTLPVDASKCIKRALIHRLRGCTTMRPSGGQSRLQVSCLTVAVVALIDHVSPGRLTVLFFLSAKSGESRLCCTCPMEAATFAWSDHFPLRYFIYNSFVFDIYTPYWSLWPSLS